jgi:hypothetical protein
VARAASIIIPVSIIVVCTGYEKWDCSHSPDVLAMFYTSSCNDAHGLQYRDPEIPSTGIPVTFLVVKYRY